MKNIVIDNISTSYYITEDGKCYNEKTNRWLKGQVNKRNGYFCYQITLPNGKKKRCSAHRLVANAFLPNPENKREVNHIDGNKLNNCIDNLEWATPQENQQHAVENELRKFDHIYCFTPDKRLVAEYKSVVDACRATGIGRSCIIQETEKDVKSLTCGFYWSKSKELGPTKNYLNTGKSKEVYQYDLNGKFINAYSSTGQAGRALGCGPSHIGECCRGKIKSYKGFIWRYKEDIVSPSNESQRDTSEVS